jgi:hypothetical protein
MMHKTSPEHQKLFREPKTIVDIFAVAIDKSHMGKKLLQKMIN